jgi:hypothetical protein
VRGCGKSTALRLLEALCADPWRSDNCTPAAIYHTLAYRERTMLLDEGDNLGLLNNPKFRAVLNGNVRGSTVDLVLRGRPQKLSVFAPIAVAAIGMLPLPLMRRSIIINMQRAATQVELFDEYDPTFAAAREQIQKWKDTCSLAPRPDMPPGFINFHADNWRVLLAIADNLGHGEAARAAAVALGATRPDEDAGVVLLRDIRTVFAVHGVDRIFSEVLIQALHALDDGMWADWCGPNDDRPPRKLNQSELAECCARSPSNREQYGRLNADPVREAAEATCARSLRRHGVTIAHQTTHQHKPIKSCT